jgi:hypothetical protein
MQFSRNTRNTRYGKSRNDVLVLRVDEYDMFLSAISMLEGGVPRGTSSTLLGRPLHTYHDEIPDDTTCHGEFFLVLRKQTEYATARATVESDLDPLVRPRLQRVHHWTQRPSFGC